jgi:hypothetical protein
MTRTCIIARIDQALDRMRVQGVAVRFIYLTEATHQEFHRAMRRKAGRRGGYFLAHGDHQIVRGQRDAIYSKQGVEFTIHKKLSHRVMPRKAAA